MSDHKSETAKQRQHTVKYCYRWMGGKEVPGCGVDVASQGDPVVPWAMNFDLPKKDFDYYNSSHPPHGPIQLRGDAKTLPFEDCSLDFCYSSHLLEDYPDWTPVLKEWIRVIKPLGHLIILIPDRELWCAACAKGQPPNDFHRHEGKVGELTTYCKELGIEPVEDRLTNSYEGDYSILFVAKKLYLPST